MGGLAAKRVAFGTLYSDKTFGDRNVLSRNCNAVAGLLLRVAGCRKATKVSQSQVEADGTNPLHSTAVYQHRSLMLNFTQRVSQFSNAAPTKKEIERRPKR